MENTDTKSKKEISNCPALTKDTLISGENNHPPTYEQLQINLKKSTEMLKDVLWPDFFDKSYFWKYLCGD